MTSPGSSSSTTSTSPHPNNSSFTKNSTVCVTVGSHNPPTENQVFHIYRDLLASRSPYFRRKLNPNGTDDDHALFVPDDNDPAPQPPITNLREANLPVRPFKQFIQYLYSAPLSTLAADHALTADTYLLAHTLESEGFRNAIVDAVRVHHVTHPTAALGLRSMVTLARTLSPDEPTNEGKCKLLEFLVAQMTYKIIVHGWEGSGFKGNMLLKRLFAASPSVVVWHLERLHGMLDEVGFTGAVMALEGTKVKTEDGAKGAGGAGVDVKPKVKRPSIGLPTNPAAAQGCCFHEHKGKKSTCSAAVAID